MWRNAIKNEKLYLNKENESIQTASLIDNGALKDIETSSYVDVSRYIVYGTHLNLEGDIKINENPSIQNAEIVVKNVSGEEIAEEFEGTDIYGENGRVTMAHEAHAKLLVSLHLNSNESDLISGGVEVYASPNSDLTLAKMFTDNILDILM